MRKKCKFTRIRSYYSCLRHGGIKRKIQHRNIKFRKPKTEEENWPNDFGDGYVSHELNLSFFLALSLCNNIVCFGLRDA